MGRFLKDCIYRFIDLSPLCQQFIDTPEFQRLRNVKQLGFVSYVYPSAVHSRFEHSLGVMHLAGVMVDQLISSGTQISSRQKDLVQLAALYHDVGHGPFSHFMDYFESSGSSHEKNSVEILFRVNDRLKLLSLEEIAMVAKMILGGDTFLYQIVHHPKGIDVDRLDYLTRDSYHTGMPSYQSDYIIKCAFVDKKTQQLVFLPKAEEDISRMLETRRRMFQTVYRHKTVIKLEECVIKMIKDNNVKITPEMDDMDVMMLLKKCPEYEKIFLCRDFKKSAEL
jgi:HD superfamily phosphohydrolase